MKFKVHKGTETFDKLKELHDRMIFAGNAAKELVSQLGGKRYASSNRGIYGGIDAIEFDVKPDGYKPVGKKYQSLFYPKASNKEILKLINQLPIIKREELNIILNFKGPQAVTIDDGIYWVNAPDVVFGDHFYLFNVVTSVEYNPPADAVEILESEYDKLKKSIYNTRKK